MHIPCSSYSSRLRSDIGGHMVGPYDKVSLILTSSTCGFQYWRACSLLRLRKYVPMGRPQSPDLSDHLKAHEGIWFVPLPNSLFTCFRLVLPGIFTFNRPYSGLFSCTWSNISQQPWNTGNSSCVCVCVLHFKPLTLTLLSNLPHLENTPQSLFPYTFNKIYLSFRSKEVQSVSQQVSKVLIVAFLPPSLSGGYSSLGPDAALRKVVAQAGDRGSTTCGISKTALSCLPSLPSHPFVCFTSPDLHLGCNFSDSHH